MAGLFQLTVDRPDDVGRSGGGAKSDFRILRYDQRGHGGTEATDGEYSFDLLSRT